MDMSKSLSVRVWQGDLVRLVRSLDPRYLQPHLESPTPSQTQISSLNFRPPIPPHPTSVAVCFLTQFTIPNFRPTVSKFWKPKVQVECIYPPSSPSPGSFCFHALPQ